MRSRLSRVLLKYLQSGQMLTDAELMDLLWPNGIPSHARVDKLVRVLRKEGYAVETVHGYRLRGEPARKLTPAQKALREWQEQQPSYEEAGDGKLQTPQAAAPVARRPGVPKTDQAQGGEAAGGNYNYGSSDGG